MSPAPDSGHSQSSPTANSHPPDANASSSAAASPNGLSNQTNGAVAQPSTASPAIEPTYDSAVAPGQFVKPSQLQKIRQSLTVSVILVAIAVMIVGLFLNLSWLGIAGAMVALAASTPTLWRWIGLLLMDWIDEPIPVAVLGVVVALICLIRFSSIGRNLAATWSRLNWDAIGASGEVIGAIGQILIAILAVYVAWRQYVISKALTIQQNLITQQQTIDSYFQGISELVLDAEGLLEDWPQERAIAEGRTAAILSSVDGTGKAKILRFLSRSKLLSPLKRDRHLGRALLDGSGGYLEDRNEGIRVVDLGVMLAAADLSHTDLRWTDLSEANLIRANLKGADLVKANLSRTILVDADLTEADLMGTRLFYGPVETASPRTRPDIPNHETGAFTGAVIENADFSRVKRMSAEQRYYCCAWGGSTTRATIPGGCDRIPNRLGR
jgi:uncharacterized protein YjbI with pentapeptide repeats